MSVANATNSTPTQTEARFTLRHFSIIIVVLALFVTGYLSYNFYTNQSVACPATGAFNCDAVLSSTFATWNGVPVSSISFVIHIVLLGLLLFEKRVAFLRDYGPMIILGITIFCFAYHCYLTFYASFTVLRALCIWCLTAHTLMTILMITSGVRVYRQFTQPVQA